MLPFQGKAQSLAFLKGIGLNVPDWRVISHDQLLSWGNQEILTQLHHTIKDKIRKLIPLQAMGFAATIMIPEIIHLERMNRSWAIRSSAKVEDSPENSFAGIFRTELGISDDLGPCVKAVWASLYSEPALLYCEKRGISWDKLAMDVILQEMMEGEVSGVLFQGEKTLINAGKGSASEIVSGLRPADLYVMDGANVESFERSSPTPALTDRELDKLMAATCKIKQHCSDPLDIEFTFKAGELFLLQARPVTVTPTLSSRTSSGLQGIICSPGVAKAQCRIYPSPTEDLKGKIIVLKHGSEINQFIFKGLAGLILEEGSLLSHAGILARELAIPCLMKVTGASVNLRDNSQVTLDADAGRVSSTG